MDQGIKELKNILKDNKLNKKGLMDNENKR
jgi:hypothetical protein